MSLDFFSCTEHAGRGGGDLSVFCQVALAPSALAADDSGTAASVAVAGGNKVKLKDGEALFKAVRIEAEAPGIYTLHAKSASRKVGCQQDFPTKRTDS